jgi:hypothetical protein
MMFIYGGIMKCLILILLCLFVNCNSTEKEKRQSSSDSQSPQIGKFGIVGQQSQKAEEHTQGYIDMLKANGFYNKDSRQQKIIASSTMLKYEGPEFEEIEQKEDNISIFNCFYHSKNLAYQIGIRYNSKGLMELVSLQIHYIDPNTGGILATHKII